LRNSSTLHKVFGQRKIPEDQDVLPKHSPGVFGTLEIPMVWRHVTFPAVASPLGVCCAILAYGAIFVALWALACFILKLRCGETLCDVRCSTWALKFAMFCHHLLAAPLSMMAILEDPATFGLFTCFGCPEVASLIIRDPSGRSAAAEALVPFTLGYMVADLVLLSQWQLSAKSSNVESWLMVAHHVFSLILWPFTLYYDYASRYVVIAISTELSSIFLTLNWMLSTSGFKQSLWYKISGFLFTSTFVVVRLLAALPQLRALFVKPPWRGYAQFFTEPPWKGYGQYPEVEPYLIWISLGLVLPHMLNFAWGVKVIKGFFGIARGSSKRHKSA